MSRFDKFVRLLAIGLGFALMALGLIGVLLPTHLLGGLLVIGLVLVLRNSFRARRNFVRLHRRHPRFLHPLRRLLRRKPEVWPVLWHEVLRAERMLPKRYRRLRRWRARLRGRRLAATPTHT